MLEAFHHALRWSHIAVGSIGLVLFWVPTLSKKGGRLNILSGEGICRECCVHGRNRLHFLYVGPCLANDVRTGLHFESNNGQRAYRRNSILLYDSDRGCELDIAGFSCGLARVACQIQRACDEVHISTHRLLPFVRHQLGRYRLWRRSSDARWNCSALDRNRTGRYRLVDIAAAFSIHPKSWCHTDGVVVQAHGMHAWHRCWLLYGVLRFWCHASVPNSANGMAGHHSMGPPGAHWRAGHHPMGEFL